MKESLFPFLAKHSLDFADFTFVEIEKDALLAFTEKYIWVSIRITRMYTTIFDKLDMMKRTELSKNLGDRKIHYAVNPPLP